MIGGSLNLGCGTIDADCKVTPPPHSQLCGRVGPLILTPTPIV